MRTLRDPFTWLFLLVVALCLCACGGPPADQGDPPQVLEWRQAAAQARALWSSPDTPHSVVPGAVDRWRHYQGLVDAWDEAHPRAR